MRAFNLKPEETMNGRPVLGSRPQTTTNRHARRLTRILIGEHRTSISSIHTNIPLLVTETTKDPSFLKTLVCLERQQRDNIPEGYLHYRKNLSTGYGLVFYEDCFTVPKEETKISHQPLDKDHPNIKKCQWQLARLVAKYYRVHTKELQRKFPVKTITLFYILQKKQRPALNKSNKEFQLDSIRPITKRNQIIYILFSIDRYSEWPAASFCKTTDERTSV